MKVKERLREAKYWHVTRKTRKFVPWLATKLPAKLKYFVVIHGMVTVEPNNDPQQVTGMQMLELWSNSAEGS